MFWANSSFITVLLFRPRTMPELLFITITMITNTGVFGYIINVLGAILQEINKGSSDF